MNQFPTNLAKALFAIQGELSGVVKDSSNPHYKSKYASLEAVIETVRPSMQKHGLTFIQSPGLYEDGALKISTSIVHADTGECIHSTISVPLQKQDPQGVGSAITYACRYSLMALLGIPPVDDDAQATVRSKEEIEWGSRDAVNTYKILNFVIDQYVTQATDAFEFEEKNKSMIELMPVKMKKHFRDRLARIGGRAGETQPQKEAAE